MLEAGAHVTIISSSQDRVNEVLKKIDNPNLEGKVGNVRDETAYTEVIKSLAPVDHLIYSGVDKIIRGAIAEADLEECKYYFGVKFWGSALTGKSTLYWFLFFMAMVTDCDQIKLFLNTISSSQAVH